VGDFYILPLNSHGLSYGLSKKKKTPLEEKYDVKKRGINGEKGRISKVNVIHS